MRHRATGHSPRAYDATTSPAPSPGLATWPSSQSRPPPDGFSAASSQTRCPATSGLAISASSSVWSTAVRSADCSTNVSTTRSAASHSTFGARPSSSIWPAVISAIHRFYSGRFLGDAMRNLAEAMPIGWPLGRVRSPPSPPHWYPSYDGALVISHVVPKPRLYRGLHQGRSAATSSKELEQQ